MPKSATQPGPGDAPSLDLNRHHRKCSVCNHPERGAIEEEFLHWHTPYSIGVRYDLHHKAIYRHAHATGLYARRRANIRSALELIIERAECAKVTGETVIHAIRAYTCLQDDGRWVEPSSHVIFSSTARSLPSDAARVLPHTPALLPQPDLPAAAGQRENGQNSSPSNEFLIVPRTIRNRPNSLETKEATQL